MSGLSPEVWTRLASGQALGEALCARQAAPDFTDRLLAALDNGRKRHLLVRVGEQAPPVHDMQSRGIQVQTRELQMAGHPPGVYIDVVCTDPSGHDAFDIVGAELAERLQEQGDAADCVIRVLAKWRRFWGQVPRDLLSRNEQLGLFAELWFLQFWLCPIVGIPQAVQRWRGPIGARHDFEWPCCSVEVKATTSTRGRIHCINGIEQLVPPENGTLNLFSLRLRDEGGATNSLSKITEACRQLLQSDDDALSMFESRLFQAGYTPAHEQEYDKLRLRVIDEALYMVRDGFPRITPAQFTHGLPSGVETVCYDINLVGSESHRISREVWQDAIS